MFIARYNLTLNGNANIKTLRDSFYQYKMFLKRYNNFFMRVEFKIQSHKNNTENLIPFSNNDNDYLFYNTFSLSFITRDQRRAIE